MSDDIELLCPTCGEPQRLPEDEADGFAPLYSLSPCDPCSEAEIEEQP